MVLVSRFRQKNGAKVSRKVFFSIMSLNDYKKKAAGENEETPTA
jgi:hypothetical protein